MQIIAHRGDSAAAPENTLSAFRQAKQKGAQWVEFDVMLTLDEVPIVIHDVTLNRTTNGSGRVANLSYQTIRSLDAGSWFDRSFQAETVPRLVEVLRLLQDLELYPNIEIKPTAARCAIKTAELTVNVLQSFVYPTNKLPLLSSFDLRCLDYVQRAAPEYPRALLLSRWRNDCCELAARYQCSSININYRALNQHRVAALNNKGFKVFAYTVNDVAQAMQLQQLGVDGIFSDHADLLDGQVGDAAVDATLSSRSE